MDLASFIPGITNTGTFSPGSTTPPPFNVSHTGLTDGTGPSTASKNMAEVYNRILLQIAATIASAGITIDNNNWTQLPQAINTLVNQGVASFTGSITTPPQFDNDTSLATSAFVQRALGNVQNVVPVTGNITVLAADAGKVFYVTGAGINITINPTGLPVGGTYTFIADGTSTTGLSTSSGGFRPTELFPSGTSMTMRPRSQYTFTWDGSYFRPINGGSANALIQYLGDTGYIRFDNGFMIQWGWDVIPIGETTRTILFSWAFPSTCRNVMLTGRSDGTTITNNNVPQLVSFTPSQFTYLNQGFIEPATTLQPNQGVYYFAVGN